MTDLFTSLGTILGVDPAEIEAKLVAAGAAGGAAIARTAGIEAGQFGAQQAIAVEIGRIDTAEAAVGAIAARVDRLNKLTRAYLVGHRAAIVAAMAEGETLWADGLCYRKETDAVRIDDLPDLVPHIDNQAGHYGIGAPAIMNMQLDMGRGEFRHPYTCDEDLTFSVPTTWSPDAYLTIGTGAMVSVQSLIVARPDQWLFRGEGDYEFVYGASGSGNANPNDLWIGWGGARTADYDDQGAAMRKFYDAIGGNEAEVKYLFGAYSLQTPVHNVPRATHSRGDMVRGTVIRTSSVGFDLFRTAGDLCRFSEMNFEVDIGGPWRTGGAWIQSEHDHTWLENMRAGAADINFDLQGDNAFARKITSYWGEPVSPIDSSLIRFGGSYARAEIIRSDTTTSFGPRSLVHIGGPAAGGGQYAISIEDVFTRSPCISVLAEAENGPLSSLQITGLDDYMVSGAAPALIDIHAKNHDVGNVRIDEWRASSRVASAIRAWAEGGDIEALNIGNGRASGTTGKGLDLVAEPGRLIKTVLTAPGTDIWGRATPVYRSGSVTKPSLTPPTAKERMRDMGLTHHFQLNPGDCWSAHFGSVFCGLLAVSSNINDATPNGVWRVRTGSSPDLTVIMKVGTCDEYDNRDLYASPGTAGRVSMAASATGDCHISNLTTQIVSFSVTVLQGSQSFEFPTATRAGVTI